jgi:hypothetical protein
MALPVQNATVLLERFPCAVGPVAHFSVRPWLETALKAGLAIGVMRAAGRGLANGYDSLRLEAGARLAIDALLRPSPNAFLFPMAGLEITYYPVPYDLVVAPRGVVASTPGVWAGVTAGMCWNAL